MTPTIYQTYPNSAYSLESIEILRSLEGIEI
jgi:hypothetical protein